MIAQDQSRVRLIFEPRQRRLAEGALLKTVGSCEGKDRNIRRGSAAAGGGREGGTEELRASAY